MAESFLVTLITKVMVDATLALAWIESGTRGSVDRNVDLEQFQGCMPDVRRKRNERNASRAKILAAGRIGFASRRSMQTT